MNESWEIDEVRKLWVGRLFVIAAPNEEKWRKYLDGCTFGLYELAISCGMADRRTFNIVDVVDGFKGPRLNVTLPYDGKADDACFCMDWFQQTIDAGFFQEYKKEEEDHVGMIQNPLTGEWRWL